MGAVAAKLSLSMDMSTRTKQKKSAQDIAAIMYASLQQFSEQEQQKRLKEIQKIGANAGRPSRQGAEAPVVGQFPVSRPPVQNPDIRFTLMIFTGTSKYKKPGLYSLYSRVRNLRGPARCFQEDKHAAKRHDLFPRVSCCTDFRG